MDQDANLIKSDMDIATVILMSNENLFVQRTGRPKIIHTTLKFKLNKVVHMNRFVEIICCSSLLIVSVIQGVMKWKNV